MKPRTAVVPEPEQPAVRRWAGIDTGQVVGLVGLVVPNLKPAAYDIDRARLIATKVVRPSTSKGYTNAGARGTLLLRVRAVLHEWQVTDVAIEEPSEVTKSWKGADGQRVTGQSTGTVFFQGAHYGLCLGACVTLPWPVRVWSYPPTTPKRKKQTERHTGDVVRGWQDNGGRIPARELTLERMRSLLGVLAARPANGRIPTMTELRALDPTDHELMALGVLNYHLHRERGELAAAQPRAMGMHEPRPRLPVPADFGK